MILISVEAFSFPSAFYSLSGDGDICLDKVIFFVRFYVLNTETAVCSFHLLNIYNVYTFIQLYNLNLLLKSISRMSLNKILHIVMRTYVAFI